MAGWVRSRSRVRAGEDASGWWRRRALLQLLAVQVRRVGWWKGSGRMGEVEKQGRTGQVALKVR